MKTVTWFTLCIFGWGIAAFLMAHLGRTLNLGTILVCNLIGYTLAIALLARNVDLTWSWNHFLGVLVSVLFVIANVAFYRLSHAGEQVTILAPMTSLYVVVTVLLGVALWHEPVTARKLLGIAMGVVALILLSGER